MSEPKLDTVMPALWDWAVKRASELKPRSLAWGGLALAGVIFLCLNLVSSIARTHHTFDRQLDRQSIERSGSIVTCRDALHEHAK